MTKPKNHFEFQERLEKALANEFKGEYTSIANQYSMTKTSWFCQTVIDFKDGKQFEMEIHMFPDDFYAYPHLSKPAAWVSLLRDAKSNYP